MGKKQRKGAKDHRTQLLVKPDDEATLRWLAAQGNKSASLRLLIKEAIARYGFVDFFDAKLAEWYSMDAPVAQPAVVAPKKPVVKAVTESVAKSVEPVVVVEEPKVEVSSANIEPQPDLSAIEAAITSFNDEGASDGSTIVEDVSEEVSVVQPKDVSLGDIDAMLAQMKGNM